ncbi:uncharacterized protein moto [Pagrus major]|uniref:uncharacterized protein moto n=1 Tax=Pagrus major TaxID=143350 RepID=UPI003CC89592
MAFDGHQSTLANSGFPTYQRQANVNVAGGNSVRTLPFSTANVSLQEQDTASYMPWSHNAHDDPNGLMNCAQSSSKSRKPTDKADCDGETDLQGLVSNILDEADSQDSYYSEGGLPLCNPVWSPKTLREELLQYFPSEDKKQRNPTFSPNYVSREAVSKAQGPSDEDVGPNGPATSQQWLFNLTNGDRDNYHLRPQKLPPGLPIPKIGNTYLPHIQQSKYDHMSADKGRGNSQPLNNFPDISDVFRSQSEVNSPVCHPYCEDDYVQSNAKPIRNEQYVPRDTTQLVSSFQSFMAGEHDSLCRGDLPNLQRHTVGMHHEDSMVQQWKITSPAVSTQSAPAMHTPKQLMEELGTVQMGRNGGVSNQTCKHDAFQDLPGLSSQNPEYFQQQKPSPGLFNLPNQYQNKTTMHRQNTALPINMSINQYSKHHIQQDQIQNKIRPHMQKEKMGMQMSGFLGEGFSARPLTNSSMRGGDKRQALSQSPYFDHLGSMQCQRFYGENSVVCAGNTQQLMPLMYPVNDPRSHSSMPINSSNFSSRSTLPHGSGVPGMDMGDMMSVNESAAFNSFVSDMMTHRGENTYHGMASAMTTSMAMNDGTPVMQLYFYLDECYEQWKCLEKERKRTEVVLNKSFSGRRTAAVTNHYLPRTPPNPTGVDHLIVNQMKEQGKVASLLDRMAYLQNMPLHINIQTALNRHHMAISITQARRKEEIANISKHQRQRANFTEDRDTLLLVIALKDLAATTRNLRTALWCGLQMTLLKPVKKQDHHVNREATGTERSPAPFEGYCFKL